MDELDALKAIDGAFSSLDENAQKRTLDWLAAKYSIRMPVAAGRPNAADDGSNPAPAGTITMTVRAIATHLDAKSGSDLVYAAAAYLAVVAARDTFSRHELLEAVKTATGFYKASTFGGGNLSKAINSLCKKGVLIEVSPQSYTVKASELTQMQQKLASAT